MRNDSLREQLGAQARERALHEFSLAAMASRTLAVYENCLRTQSHEQA
jgi:hypothetical protein